MSKTFVVANIPSNYQSNEQKVVKNVNTPSASKIKKSCPGLEQCAQQCDNQFDPTGGPGSPHWNCYQNCVSQGCS